MANIFSKAWKGVKKTFKKIGKGIKKGFAKFGKFMNKFGIAGQIGMMFIMPGIGSAMMKGFGTMLKGLGAVTGPLSGIASAAQTVLGAAGNFARLVAKPFTTITDGVTSFLSNTTKYLGNKISGVLGKEVMFQGAPTTFLGSDGVLGKVGEGISKNLAGFGDIASDLMSNDISAFMPQPASMSSIDDPIKTPPSREDMDAIMRGPDGTLPVDPKPTSGPKPEIAATGEKGFFGQAADKVVEEFSPSSLLDKGIEGTAQGVTDVAQSAAMDAIGLGPEDPEAPDYIRPVGEFRSDQSTLAIGLQPVSYAGYVSDLTVGNPNNIGYGGSQSYNAWMQRAVA